MSEVDQVPKARKWMVLFIVVMSLIGMATVVFLLLLAGWGWLLVWIFWGYVAVWAFVILFGWTGKARIR